MPVPRPYTAPAAARRPGRHTFCTRYTHSGGDARDLQALAGHADFKTTRNYLHEDRDHARETINRMAADLRVPADGHKLGTGTSRV